MRNSGAAPLGRPKLACSPSDPLPLAKPTALRVIDTASTLPVAARARDQSPMRRDRLSEPWGAITSSTPPPGRSNSVRAILSQAVPPPPAEPSKGSRTRRVRSSAAVWSALSRLAGNCSPPNHACTPRSRSSAAHSGKQRRAIVAALPVVPAVSPQRSRSTSPGSVNRRPIRAKSIWARP